MLVVFVRDFKKNEFYKELRLENEPVVREEFVLPNLEIDGIVEKTQVEIGPAMGYKQEDLVCFVWFRPRDKRKRPGATWKIFERQDIHDKLWQLI